MSLLESATKSLFKHIEVVLLVSGVLFLSASLIEELPTSSNAWKIIFRQSPNIIVLVIGAVQWLAALALVILPNLSLKPDKKSTPSTKSTVTVPRVAQPKAAYTPAFNESTKDVDPNRVVSNFKALSPTQMAIILKFYETKNTEMAVDDLFDLFQNDHPGKIETRDELYFRAMDLFHAGLIGVSKTGEKTTLLVWLPKVGSVLIDKDLLRTQN